MTTGTSQPTTKIINFQHQALGTVRPIYRTGTPQPSKHPILYIFFSTNLSD
jgi:hypothetical protein